MTSILIAEDEPSIALGLEEDLTLEGYAVEVVGDGQAAVDRARARPFGLVLLDVMLPHKDGFQVCRELRRVGVTTPIILLTARAQEAEKVLGLQLGADDYVTKPFSRRIARAHRGALRRANASALSETYRFGDVVLDVSRCELTRGGVPVEITPVEFKLLAAFIRHRGRVLSRGQLLDEVWGDVHTGDRVVDTHVANLRKKIEPEPAEPRYLISLRGLGYRFDG
jgi:DNA-binding response OmpR family regulator